MLYIEFQLPRPTSHRHYIGRASLQRDLERWAFTHNIDTHSVRSQFLATENRQRVELPSDRAVELFCLSWNPVNDQFRNYRLRRL
jgi:hypothetical protein